jgi:phosphopentomutase
MRALLLVLDSVGCGGAPDAAAYKDEGANTLGHLYAALPEWNLPVLESLGLRQLLQLSANPNSAAWPERAGIMQEKSAGKDTTTGHWELAGVILEKPFPVFSQIPPELVQSIEQEAGVKFIGNYAASGTEILAQLGPEHLRTGYPILYTSADSVLQIAAHEEFFGLERLYTLCQIARRHADPWQIGRVIARPFLGQSGAFQRTAHRHDYSYPPPPTVLNALQAAQVRTIGIGKISDIFAGQGITESLPTANNQAGMDQISRLWQAAENSDRATLLVANLVDFDMLFGHRRDVAGYAKALSDFDHWLGSFLQKIGPQDLVLITADHGNDPTWTGTDHTREQVPIFLLGRSPTKPPGLRQTYADVAATLTTFFGAPPWPVGRSML